MIKLVIDPGHGGSDPGAQGNGLIEKNVNLNIALRVAQILSGRYADHIDFEMTRTKDTSVSLAERVALAHQIGANWFLSIHANAHSSPAVRGYEDYRHPSASQLSVQYHQNIHLHLSDVFRKSGSPNRGQKTANFYVLRMTRMPATLLECGFLTNREDALLLANYEFLDVLSNAIVASILDIFNIPAKDDVEFKHQLEALGKAIQRTKEEYDILEKRLRGLL